MNTQQLLNANACPQSNAATNCSTDGSRQTNSLESAQGLGSIDQQSGANVRHSAEPQVAFTVNDFEPIEKIGAGKFGHVFKAKEKRSQAVVALKKVKKELLNNYDFYQ